MSYNQFDDYLLVKVDNQSNIKLISVNSCNLVTSLSDNLKSSLSSSSESSSAIPSSTSSPLVSDSVKERHQKLINLIGDQLKYWIDSLGVQSAEAQNLKEPITCHTRFIQGSFRPHSPLKHKDSIYFLVQQSVDYFKPTTINEIQNIQSLDEDNGLPQLIAVGFIRVGLRNLFLQNLDKLVNVNRCFSILDFYITRQRQGLGKLLISAVLKDQSIAISKCAFDRPTTALLSFLGKHFNLGSPQKQHNRFVIYNGFFS